MKKLSIALLVGLLALFVAACGNEGTARQSEIDNAQADLEAGEEENRSEAGEAEADGLEDGATVEGEAESRLSDEAATAMPIELFFADDEVMNIYKVKTSVVASEEELFQAALEAWIAGPEDEDLTSLVPTNVKVQSIEEREGIAHVSFSSELLEANVGSGIEEMLLQQIAMTMKQFGFDETQILIDGEIHDQLFGHMDTNVPIVANDPGNYEEIGSE